MIFVSVCVKIVGSLTRIPLPILLRQPRLRKHAKEEAGTPRPIKSNSKMVGVKPVSCHTQNTVKKRKTKYNHTIKL